MLCLYNTPVVHNSEIRFDFVTLSCFGCNHLKYIHGPTPFMAPVCVAGRQLLRPLCVFLLFVILVAQTVNTLLVYDRQTLLDLRISAKNLINFDYYGQKTLPPFLLDIPTHLCRTPALPPRQKRHRRRGKRSGCLVRLRTGLVRPDRGGYGAGPRLCISRRSLDLVAAWLVPVAGSDGMFQPRGPCSPCLRWRGVNPGNLRPLCRASLSAVRPDPPAPARFGLVNARSLAINHLSSRIFSYHGNWISFLSPRPG